jgi:phosphate starvation-inducible PhoH-like protein
MARAAPGRTIVPSLHRSHSIALILRHAFQPADNTRLSHLAGVLDGHLRSIESAFGVRISRRHEAFRVDGAKDMAERALALLQSLYGRAARPIGEQALQLAIADALGRPSGGDADPYAIVLRTRRADLEGRTPNQRQYLRHILDHDMSFGIGPAGTGKTFLAVACAVDALERSSVQRIILTRPAVEAGERLGFLPGDLMAKVDPYLRPLFDALNDMLDPERVTAHLEKGVIEVAPLAFMRGRTLNDAFVILDEAQNTSPEQMKMFLTRLGFGSKMVVNGDISQIDLPRDQRSGLVEVGEILRGVEGVGVIHFGNEDVVRHKIVQRIVQAYAEHAERSAPGIRPASSQRRA